MTTAALERTRSSWPPLGDDRGLDIYRNQAMLLSVYATRRWHVRALSLSVAVMVVLVACSAAHSPASNSTSSSSASIVRPLEFALPRFSPTTLPGHSAVCEPDAITGILRADVSDPLKVWLADNYGSRDELLWPADYHVMFEPNATILDETGVAVLHEGDAVTRVCHTGMIGIYWLDPPFQASPSQTPSP